MGRPRLTDAEREIRRQERIHRTFKSEERFNHYDPSTEGYGSEAEWLRIAEDILKGKGLNKPSYKSSKYSTQMLRDLAALFLDALPETAELLKTAFRNALKKVHPDMQNGSHEACLATMAAFKSLSKHYI